LKNKDENMKISRLYFLLILTLALSLLSATFVTAQDTTELQMAWWGSQNRHDRTIQVIDMFKAANPGVEIVYEFAAFNDYWTLLNTKAAGQQLPCIMQQDYAFLSEWQSRGLLAPLDPFIESGVIDTTNIDPLLLDGGKVGDEIYAISLGSNSQSFILDVDAFESAGLELPDPQWTWTDFEEIAMQLHEQLDVWAINIGVPGVGNAGLEDVQMWKGVNLGVGQPMVIEDGTALGITDWQPTIEYFNMIQRLQAAGALPTGEEATEFGSVPLESSQIVTGSTAMQYQWSNQVVAIYTGAGPERNFRLWHLPRSEGGAATNYLKPSQFFSITSTCETPELAAQVINFFTNDLEANEALFAERGVPISSAVRDHLRPMLDTASAETFDYLERVAADSSPLPPPDPPNWSNFTSNVYGALFAGPLTFGQITPEEAVVILEEEGNKVLAGDS
jgi:multiple sugar transport system substrate-binding protein